MTITEHSDADLDTGVQDKPAGLRRLVLEAFGPDDRLTVTDLLTRIAGVNPGFGSNTAAVRAALAEIGVTPIKTDGRHYYQRPVAQPALDGPHLRAAVIAAFDGADRIEAGELFKHLGDTDPHFLLNLATLKSGLAELGITPENGTEGRRFYQRSPAIGPVSGGEQLLSTLSGMVATGRRWQAEAETRAQAQRRAEQERTAAEHVARAAGWWRAEFRTVGVEPPMLDWVGYPLPDGRNTWEQHEENHIHALAFLGNGMFLAHRSRTISGSEYSNTKHTGLLIAPCGNAEHHEHRVQDITSLGDVLDQIADGTCPEPAEQHTQS